MSDLLLPSMSTFDDLLLGALDIAGARHVVEVGAGHGTLTRALLEHTHATGGTLVSIDNAPTPETEQLFADTSHARLVREPGLDALTGRAADAYLIDGGHNYWTVLEESRRMWEATREAETPLLVFYHGVGWPWGRRDHYDDPTRIPAEFVRPHTWKQGVTLDHAGVVDGGLRGMGSWACALAEGGPRNGVLTAIEDFVLGKEEHLAWASIPAVGGLGILFEKDAPWAIALAQAVLPFHENRLLARLERNRLECYLRVIALQDSTHAVTA